MSISSEQIVKALQDAKDKIRDYQRQATLLKEAFNVVEKQAFYASKCSEILTQRLTESENERKILIAAISYSCKHGGTIEDILKIVNNESAPNPSPKSDSSENEVGRSIFSNSSPILISYSNSTLPKASLGKEAAESILSDVKSSVRNNSV